MGLIPLKAWLIGGALVAILAGFWWGIAHERAIGRLQIEQQDIAGKAVLDSQVKADEQIAQLAADKAAEDRKGVQKQLDDYMAAHPIGPIRLCHSHDSGAGLPQAASVGGSATHPGTGPATVPEMFGRDLTSGLTAIMRAATELDGLYQARQKLDDRSR